MNLPENKSITMTTLEIAQLTNKDHSHVKRDCDNMFKELDLQGDQFRTPLKMPSGQVAQVYNLDRRLTEILVTGYSIKLRAAVIDRLRELESGNAIISNDPIIAMRQEQLRIIDEQNFIKDRLEQIEKKAISVSGERELIKEYAPDGYANKGDVADVVSSVVGCTKSIVLKAIEYYDDKILKSNYTIQVLDESNNIVSNNVKCYKIQDVIKSVNDAIANSVNKTEYFRVFPTLGNKSMKIKVGE